MEEKNKIPLNYRIFRWACILFWLLFIPSIFLFPDSEIRIIATGELAIYMFLILNIVAIVVETSGWFTKVEK